MGRIITSGRCRSPCQYREQRDGLPFAPRNKPDAGAWQIHLQALQNSPHSFSAPYLASRSVIIRSGSLTSAAVPSALPSPSEVPTPCSPVSAARAPAPSDLTTRARRQGRGRLCSGRRHRSVGRRSSSGDQASWRGLRSGA